MKESKIRIIILIVLITQFSLLNLAQDTAQPPRQHTTKLEQGKSIKRELKSDEIHTYLIQLKVDQLLSLIVDECDARCVVEVFTPDGKQLTKLDVPYAISGLHSYEIKFIAETTGEYQLKVSSRYKEAPAVYYQVRIEELQDSSDFDRKSLTAQKKYFEARMIEQQFGETSMRKSIGIYKQAALLWREAGNQQMEAETLTHLGELKSMVYEVTKAEALEYLNQAVLLWRILGEKQKEADTLASIADIYYVLNDQPKAFEYINQALSLRQTVQDSVGAALRFTAIGNTNDSSTDKQKKELGKNKSGLSFGSTSGNPITETFILRNIGVSDGSLEEVVKSLDYLYKTLPPHRAAKQHHEEGRTLATIGVIYSELGEEQKAIQYFNQALQFKRNMGDRAGEAFVLTMIGSTYNELGEKQNALDYYSQSLILSREIGDTALEANIHAYIGAFYRESGIGDKARQHYSNSRGLMKAIRDRRGEAYTLIHNLEIAAEWGWISPQFFNYSKQSLLLMRDVGDRYGEAINLAVIGVVYDLTGETGKGLYYLS